MSKQPSPTPASNALSSSIPSYLQADNLGPWGIYLQQVDRVLPYLGNLARWAETQILIHGERGKADIHPIKEAHDIQQRHKRNDPPSTFGENTILAHIPLRLGTVNFGGGTLSRRGGPSASLFAPSCIEGMRGAR